MEREFGGEKHHVGTSFFFMETDDGTHSEGPKLLHFRLLKLNDVIKQQNKVWKEILEKRIGLPTSRAAIQ